MGRFVLFPHLDSEVEWLKGHGAIVIQYGWNIVAALILFFVGKLISRLVSGGLHKLLVKRKVDTTIVHFFTALVRYICLLYTSPKPTRHMSESRMPSSA